MIRQAFIEDSADIRSICELDLGYPCEEAMVRSRLERLDPARECVLVDVEEGHVVGFVHVEKYEVLYFPPMANILGLAVSAAYRRKGLGKALLQAAENRAREMGVSYMRLNSGGTRTEAHAFYRSAGYDDEKVQLRFMKQLL